MNGDGEEAKADIGEFTRVFEPIKLFEEKPCIHWACWRSTSWVLGTITSSLQVNCCPLYVSSKRLLYPQVRCAAGNVWYWDGTKVKLSYKIGYLTHPLKSKIPTVTVCSRKHLHWRELLGRLVCTSTQVFSVHKLRVTALSGNTQLPMESLTPNLHLNTYSHKQKFSTFPILNSEWKKTKYNYDQT